MKWEYNADTVELINKSNAPILAITGVSGSGKSYLTENLSRHYASLSIIKNYTTRPQRKSDNNTNFAYISDNDFNELLTRDAFFLARHEEYPCYGYLKDEVVDVIKNKKIPLFMFRHSGIKMITSILSNVNVIAIYCEPSESIKRSKDETTIKSVESAFASQTNIFNRTEHHNSQYVLINHYDDTFVNNEGLHTFIQNIRL